MGANQPLGENKDVKENQRESYYKTVLKNAEQRELVSDSLLKEMGVNNTRDFINKACLAAKTAKYPIEELKENESISLKVLQLQDYVLGFRFEDNKNGCDAKLGPITYNALLEKFPVLKDYVEKRQTKLKDQKGTRRDLAGSINLPGARPAQKPAESSPEAIQGREFIEKWNYIKNINDPNQLLGMKDSFELNPNDPLVSVPDEKGMRLREGAALRYLLFKRYAALKGYRIMITSAYRSALTQVPIWERTLRANGGDARKAMRWAAPPGRSHHNTGGAVDIRIFGQDGKQIYMHRYRGSKAAFERAVATGETGGMEARDRIAVETKRFMDEELKASHFLGQNYHAENWHWNIDGRRVYQNV